MLSDPVIISTITAICGLLGIYIANRFKNVRPRSPERIDVAFEALEKIIKIKDEEIKIKDTRLEKQAEEIEYLRGIIRKQ